MSTLQNTLKQLRSSRNLTQSELADIMQISKSCIAMYETGKREPDIATLNKLADFFDTDINYLINGDISSRFSNIYPISKRKIPLLGEISCGEPIFCDEEKGSYIEMADSLNVDFCLKASGDSMTGARINDGDLVFIRSQSMVENGEIAAVIIGDEALLKRVYIYPDKIVLTPENPKYEPLVFVKEELNNIRIIGKAVAFQSCVR